MTGKYNIIINNIKKYVSVYMFMLILLLLSYILYYKYTNNIVYIDNNRLFTSFKATKELEEIAKKELSGMYNQLDSINKVISAIEREYKLKPTDDIEQNYYILSKRKEALSNEYMSLQQEKTQTIYKQSWNALNGYIIEFGKKHKYKFIYGANGNGTIMYANDKFDITDKVIEFANKKYTGK